MPEKMPLKSEGRRNFCKGKTMKKERVRAEINEERGLLRCVRNTERVEIDLEEI